MEDNSESNNNNDNKPEEEGHEDVGSRKRQRIVEPTADSSSKGEGKKSGGDNRASKRSIAAELFGSADSLSSDDKEYREDEDQEKGADGEDLGGTNHEEEEQDENATGRNGESNPLEHLFDSDSSNSSNHHMNNQEDHDFDGGGFPLNDHGFETEDDEPEEEEDPNDTNIITIAILEEIWKHFVQQSTPLLSLEDQVLNAAATEYLVLQMDRLAAKQQKQDNENDDNDDCDDDNNNNNVQPTRLLLQNCEFPQEHDARQFATRFVERYKGNWEAIHICHRRSTNQPIHYVPLLHSIMECHLLDTLQFSGIILRGQEIGRALRGVLESPQCNLSALRFNCSCVIDMACWTELMQGVQSYRGFSYLQFRDCIVGTFSLENDNSLVITKEALMLFVRTLSVAASTTAATTTTSHLKSLDFSRTALTAASCGGSASLLLAKLFERLPSLERLNLSGRRGLFGGDYFKDDDDFEEQQENIKALYETLVNHPALKVLDLSHCGILVDSARALFQILQENTATSLLTLNLRRNDFPGETVTGYLPHFKSLCKLALPPRSDSSHRQAFVRALKQNTVLVECRCHASDLNRKNFASIFRRNAMIHRARALLSAPLGAWPNAFEILPEPKDRTALFVALQVAQPGLVGSNSERLHRAAEQAVPACMDIPEGWEEEEPDETPSPGSEPESLVGRRVKRIVGHQGPLADTSPFYRGSSYNVQIQWEDGTQSQEPLDIVAKNDPASCAAYAKLNDLLHTAGWRQFRRLAKGDKKLLRAASQGRVDIPEGWEEEEPDQDEEEDGND